MRRKRVGQWGCRLPPLRPHPSWAPAHPLLIELQQLLRHPGSAEGQAQAVDVELRDDVLQGVPRGQAPPGAMLPGGGRGVLQDGAPQGGQLLQGEGRETGLSGRGKERESPRGCSGLTATCVMVRSLDSGAGKHCVCTNLNLLPLGCEIVTK